MKVVTKPWADLYEKPEGILQVNGSPIRGQQLGRPPQGLDGCTELLQLEATAAKPHPSLSIARRQLQCSCQYAQNRTGVHGITTLWATDEIYDELFSPWVLYRQSQV